jgi:hypothetical protein
MARRLHQGVARQLGHVTFRTRFNGYVQAWMRSSSPSQTGSELFLEYKVWRLNVAHRHYHQFPTSITIGVKRRL